MSKKSQYEKEREFTSPYTCGLNRADMTLTEMRSLVAELTEKEKQSPYAEFYYDRMREKTPEQQAAYEKPLEQAQMYMPCDCGKIMIEHQSDYPSLGYGVLDNGVGYAAIRIDQTDVNDDMIREYREKYCHDVNNRDLFYKVWYPGKHIRHFEDGIIEDFGYGMMVLEMNREIYTLAHAGITKEYIEEKDPHALNFLLVGGGGYMLWAPEITQQSLMVQYTRETESGRVLYVHFWLGLTPNADGTVTPKPIGDKEEVLIKMRHQYNHCVTEYNHELKHMKEFWNMNHPDRRVPVL